MKIYTKVVNIVAIGLIATLLASAEAAAVSYATLVFDSTVTETQTAKQYRVATDLRASASGQFSGDELCNLLTAIPAIKSQIWIIDLRQESHGFIDGIPVSWYLAKNGGNINKSSTQIQKEETKLLFELSKQKSVAVYKIIKLGGGKVSFGPATTMIPELVETEQQLVTSHGANYKRIYVLDHNKPDDREVDQFINFIRKVKPQDWLHFHCRGGKGRSSTFIVMYDIIRNGHNSSLDKIIQRQVKLGNIQLDKLPIGHDKQWKSAASKQRYEFLQKFYKYVLDSNGYRKGTWSSWNQKR